MTSRRGGWTLVGHADHGALAGVLSARWGIDWNTTADPSYVPEAIAQLWHELP